MPQAELFQGTEKMTQKLDFVGWDAEGEQSHVLAGLVLECHTFALNGTPSLCAGTRDGFSFECFTWESSSDYLPI